MTRAIIKNWFLSENYRHLIIVSEDAKKEENRKLKQLHIPFISSIHVLHMVVSGTVYSKLVAYQSIIYKKINDPMCESTSIGIIQKSDKQVNKLMWVAICHADS